MNSDTPKKRILVVDDTLENRQLLALILNNLGYLVEQAENGPDALLQLSRNKPDLILLDFNMPGMDGTQVLTEIRKNYSPLQQPVIMVTANDQQESIVKALSLGANDYLVKPVNREITAERIRTQLTLAHLSQLQEDVVHFASHDLKKPMLVMQDIVDMAMELDLAEPSHREELRELLTLIKSTNSRMQEVVRGFLSKEDHEKNEYDVSTEANVNGIILDVCQADLPYANKKSIALRTELDDNLPSISIPDFKIRQVLENFVGNAIKFCPQHSLINIASKKESGQILVTVSDNGPGLTEQDFKFLFMRNVKLSNKPTGEECSTGIGLPLCKELIESVAGRIGAYNNKDRGVTFWFRVPFPV